MTFHDFTWGCTVALVYLLSFTGAMLILLAHWRKISKSRPPWDMLGLISMFGPIGLCVAIAIWFLDAPSRKNNANQ